MTTTPKPIQIRYVSAPCGSGKTTATCKHIKDHQYLKNHLYVAPTLRLVNETAQQLQKLGIEAKVISTDTTSKVVGDIMDFISHCKSRGSVLLITFNAFLLAPKFVRKENWDIFIDEIPQLDQFYDHDLHQNPEQLLDHIELGEPVNEFIFPVQAIDNEMLLEHIDNPDEVTEQFLPLFRDVLNPNKDVFIELKKWKKFTLGEFSESRDSNMIYFLSLLNPNILEDTTLLGAHVEQSLLYDWFNRYYEVKFERRREIESGLRYTTHSEQTSKRLRICYLLPDRGYSKELRKTEFKKGTGTTWCEVLDLAVQQYFGDKPFIYAVNNDYKGGLKKLPEDRQISVMSHGSNAYDHETGIYFGAALNRQPQHLKLLHRLGFSSETIKSSTLHECAYQAIMRTALRRPDETGMVEVVVPEKHTADRLVEIFGGADVKWIGNDEFRKVKPLSPSDRKRRKKQSDFKDSLFTGKMCSQKLGCDQYEDKCLHRSGYEKPLVNKEKSIFSGAENLSINSLSNQSMLSEAKNRVAVSLLLTFQKDRYAQHADDFVVKAFDPQRLVKLLRDSSKVVINNKKEIFLINPAVYDQTDPEGHRRQVNFLQSCMMILDFDGGDVSIEDFERIFWHEAGQFRRPFVICNSYSRTAENPNKFRVFLLYKTPALSLEAHQAVFDSVVMRLEDNGFKDNSGLDPACRHGTQSFYMPCTNRAHLESAYFANWGTKSRDVQSRGIDPQQVLKTTPRRPERVQLQVVGGSNHKVSDDQRNRLISQYKDAVRNLNEGRHKPFYDCALKLMGLGLPDHEIEWHLTELERDIEKTGENWTRYAIESLRKARRVEAVN